MGNKFLHMLIFVLFGIILYILLNGKDGFSIGGKNDGEICDPSYNDCNIEGGTCAGQCNCIDDGTGIFYCRKVTGGSSGGGGGACAPPSLPDGLFIYVNMMGRSEESDQNQCEKQDKCQAPIKFSTVQIPPFQRNSIIYDLCPMNDSWCEGYHTMPYLCTNQCQVEISHLSSLDKNDMNTKRMEESGFEYIEGIFDTEDLLYQQYLKTLETEYRTNPTNMYGYVANSEYLEQHDFNFSDYDLFFQEYILLKYLEKIHYPNKVHIIKFGIFYINGLLYFYKLSNCLLRGDMLQDMLQDVPEDQLFRNVLLDGGFSAFQTLHFDYANYPFELDDLYPPLNDEEMERLESNPQYEELLRELGNTNIESFFRGEVLGLRRYIRIKQIQIDKDYINRLMRYIGSFEGSLEYFNIWLKINGTPNAKTLAFADINEGELPGMLVDVGNPNISRINKNRTAPWVNYNGKDKVLYTPKTMNNGDILRFDTKRTPHTALHQEPDQWRLSVESRYCTLKIPFNIEDFYTIDDDNQLVKKPDVTLAETSDLRSARDQLYIDEIIFGSETNNGYFNQKYTEYGASSMEQFKGILNMRSIFD